MTRRRRKTGDPDLTRRRMRTEYADSFPYTAFVLSFSVAIACTVTRKKHVRIEGSPPAPP